MLDTCAKFHDHQNNNNKVMMGGPYAPPPITDGSKKAHAHTHNDLVHCIAG